MVCCMMWNVCGLDGQQSGIEVVQNGVVTEGERMVWNGGVKLLCGVECHGVNSVRISLFFLYCVVFSVMSVQYCLCVSRIQCTQCSVSVYTASAQLYSVQCK